MRPPASVTSRRASRSIDAIRVPPLSTTPVAARPLGPAIGVSWGRSLPREHGLRQRRLLVGLVMLVVEQHNLGGGVLLLGGQCRCAPRRSASDNDDLARDAHARRADSISSMYSSPLAITSIEA